MSDLQSRLQEALGDAYRIERELGGGGMSRVFLAEDVQLGRQVVVKVLPPEMGAGVNVDRFRREIQLAAKLQHPHIVPLLSAGSHDDLLYYMMPFIQGESLRAKLAREGELPVTEAVRILKEVLDALAYAHRHHVVHRDIKPDNVLLSENHAVVTDFGVAKAVSASTGDSAITSLGVALGTPAYMAPEQAAADPNVDHRADLYAVGAMAYEMLTGRPPFTGANPQSVLSAQITEPPEPVTRHRSAVPPALGEIVMRCLEKKAADRWQRADQVIPQLDALLTPTGGTTPAGTQPYTSSGTEAAIRRGHPLRVIALFGLASVGAIAIVYSLVQLLGLPDWVVLGAVVLLAIGLPIMVFTGHHERQRAQAKLMGTAVTTPTGVRQHFTWRKAILGGGLAFAGLGVVTAGYMAMRLLGIGPVGTLVAAGVLDERGRILLADFENRTADSTLGPSVTDAFRVDLGQSRVIKLVDASQLSETLRRMERDPNAPIDLALAREIAEREGITAVVSGEIGPVGRGYVLSASVVAASDGAVLTAVRETAADEGAIIPAIDRLSGKLRERIGESLRDIRGNQPLERVTTRSLEALRKYSQALRAEELGEFDRALSLLDEAVSLDTTFAMAYRKQAVILGNTFAGIDRTMEAATKAYRHRERLPDVERYLAEAYYHFQVEYDRTRLIAAYQSALELDPDNTTALNNLALELIAMRRYEEAEALVRQAIATDPSGWTYYAIAMDAQVGQGRWEAAESTLAQLGNALGEDSPHYARFNGDYHAGRGNWQQAREIGRRILETHRASFWQAGASFALAGVAGQQGRISDAEQHFQRFVNINEADGRATAVLFAEMQRALLRLKLRDDRAGATRLLDEALERHPLAEMPPSNRPYSALAEIYADAGRVERAKALMAEHEQAVPESLRRGDLGRYGAEGAIALAERRFADAVRLFRQHHEVGDNFCTWCALYRLGETYDLAGQADSALVAYERAVSAPHLFNHYQTWHSNTQTLKRLGELYEQRGNRDKAVEYYNQFVDRWNEADAELQPVVREVRQRIANLVEG